MNILLPFGFQKRLSYKGIKINYIDVVEMGQGGLEIGKLAIDGINHFPDYYFGGPLVFMDYFIYVPVLKQNFFSTGFKLGVINLSTFSIELIGKREMLILIHKIENGKLYYYNHINKSVLKSINI